MRYGSYIVRWGVFAAIAFSAFSAAQGYERLLREPIAAGPVSDVLAVFRKRMGIRFVVLDELTAGRISNGAPAGLTPDDTLRRLLEKTGLSYSWLNDKTIAITPAPATAAVHVGEGGKPSDSQEGQLSLRPGASSGSDRVPDASVHETESFDEIVLTGTHVRGSTPSSKIVMIDSEQFQKAGIGSLSDAIRTLTQGFSGGQNPAIVGAGDPANNQNLTGGTKVNLRGLGTGASLTLVNGHRLPDNGYQGGADLSGIPLAAVDRVEVLTDGASATYGSDAIAGVTNVILKDTYSGAEGRARLGLTSEGGGAQKQVTGTYGANWESGFAMLTSEYKQSDEVLSRQRPFTRSLEDPTTIMPAQRALSGLFQLRHEMPFGASLFLDGLVSSRRMSQTYTFLGSQTLFDIRNDQHGVTLGAKMEARAWQVSGSSTMAADHAAYKFQSAEASEDGRGENDYGNDLDMIEFNANGPLFSARTGVIRMALGVGYRDERFSYANPNAPSSNFDAARHISYGFSEVRVPLCVPARLRGFRLLDLTFAARHERYSRLGTTTNPKIGLIYKPYGDLTLRASWGTSFRAPPLAYTNGIRQVAVYPLPLATPSGQDQLLMVGGGNSLLDPETARTWSLSADYRSPAAPAFSASTSLFFIRYSNRIVSPFSSYTVPLSDPAPYSSFVTINPTELQQRQLIDSATLGRFRNLSGLEYSSDRVAYLLRADYQNVAERTARGVDIQSSHTWSLPTSSVQAFVNASYLHETQRFSPGSEVKKISGTVFNPAELRLRGGVGWQAPYASLLVAVNYLSGAENSLSAGQQRVSSWTTMDAALTWLPQGIEASRDFEVHLSAQNLTGREPPYVAPGNSAMRSVPYDSTNVTPMGRLLSFEVRMRF